jgi:SAM-dependent methyltransferase
MPPGVEPVASCPVCGSGGQAVVLEEPNQIFPTGMLRLVRCDVCGLVFLNPRMTRDAMIEVENRSDVYSLDAEAIEREIEARVQLLNDLGSFAPRRDRLLDIGCNRGLLLAAAQRLGCEAVGVELSPAAAARARESTGARVYEDLSEVPRAGGFDLIVAWHVLEHTPDPVSLLSQARRLLAPRGVLAVQVPSFDFVEEFRKQGRTSSIVCAVHNLCFTESTLSDSLRRAGFARPTTINSDADLMLTALAGLPRRTYLARRLTRLRRPSVVT